jgi:hypothetical protein
MATRRAPSTRATAICLLLVSNTGQGSDLFMAMFRCRCYRWPDRPLATNEAAPRRFNQAWLVLMTRTSFRCSAAHLRSALDNMGSRWPMVVTVREGPVRLGRHERREAMVGGMFVCVAGTGGCPIRALSRPICVRRTCRNRLAIVVVTGRSATGLCSSRRVPGLLPV